MIACDRIRPLLSALIDGELSPDEIREARSHLNTCEACRREWESLQDLDRQLMQLLVVRNVEARSTEIAHASEMQTMHDTHSWGLAGWVSIFFAIAAVLLLAIVPALLPELDVINPPTPAATEVARLVRSTGPVQVLSPGTSDWTDLDADSSRSLVAGSRLKTRDDVVCELETSSKGTIRLNKSAELVFRDPNLLELVSGQLWCLAPEDRGIDVDVAIQNAPSPQIAIFACPSASEIQCEAGNDRAFCNSVSTGSEQASLTIGEFSCEVAPGEMVSIDAAHKVDRVTSADSSTKLWQLPLLSTDQGDRELVSLLNHVLAPIGMTKAMHMNEQQIRKLGPAAAIPLLAYVAHESSPEHLPLRRTAMRLAADLADENTTALLASLQADPDPVITDLAKTTLARLLDKSD